MIQFDTIRLSGLTNVDLPIFGGSLSEPYQISAADGLGPPELDVLLAETHAPGGIFINRRAQGRQIVIRCGLNPDHTTGETISDLRYALYGLLSPGVNPGNQSIKVILLRDNLPQVETSGYVQRIEIVPFNKEPEVQITITCLGPYLNAPEITEVTSIPETASWTIDNPGLAPTGIAFEVEFTRAESAFTIEVLNANIMRFYGDFVAGDRLTVDTSEASRFVGLWSGGGYTKYMELLAADSTWLTLHGGVHTIQTSDPTGFNWNYFRFRTRHWGI